MVEPNLFTIDRDGAILIVALPNTPVSFFDEEILEEVESICEILKDPAITNLVMDFGQCPYFGSAILGAVVTLYINVRDRQRHFTACNITKDGRELLQISKFDTLWPIFDSREEALNSIKH